MDDLVKRDSIFLYLNNTNVRIGSAVVSIEKEADQSRWIVSQNFEITEKEKKQSIRLRSIVDTQLQTHFYEERLNVEDEEIFSVTVALNVESAEYIATEKRDGVEFQTHSFKSQYSYPILFPGTLTRCEGIFSHSIISRFLVSLSSSFADGKQGKFRSG